MNLPPEEEEVQSRISACMFSNTDVCCLCKVWTIFTSKITEKEKNILKNA